MLSQAAAAEMKILRRDRLTALASLLAIISLAWVYLWIDADRMDAPMMPMARGWNLGSLLSTALMWSVMMIGMMLPSAAPAILLYGAMVRKNGERGSVLPAVWIFTAGYLAVWFVFSLAATVLQVSLEQALLLSPMMTSTSVWLSGCLLITAGVYQWLPIKEACLNKCRAPLQFLLFHWRAGRFGTLRMGAEHGAFCVGCCWALMLLLFAVGVMNLLWVALIAGFVLIEKVLPPRSLGGRWIGRTAGVMLAVAGTVMILDA